MLVQRKNARHIDTWHTGVSCVSSHEQVDAFKCTPRSIEAPPPAFTPHAPGAEMGCGASSRADDGRRAAGVGRADSANSAPTLQDAAPDFSLASSADVFLSRTSFIHFYAAHAPETLQEFMRTGQQAGVIISMWEAHGMEKMFNQLFAKYGVVPVLTLKSGGDLDLNPKKAEGVRPPGRSTIQPPLHVRAAGEVKEEEKTPIESKTSATTVTDDGFSVDELDLVKSMSLQEVGEAAMQDSGTENPNHTEVSTINPTSLNAMNLQGMGRIGVMWEMQKELANKILSQSEAESQELFDDLDSNLVLQWCQAVVSLDSCDVNDLAAQIQLQCLVAEYREELDLNISASEIHKTILEGRRGLQGFQDATEKQQRTLSQLDSMVDKLSEQLEVTTMLLKKMGGDHFAEPLTLCRMLNRNDVQLAETKLAVMAINSSFPDISEDIFFCALDLLHLEDKLLWVEAARHRLKLTEEVAASELERLESEYQAKLRALKDSHEAEVVKVRQVAGQVAVQVHGQVETTILQYMKDQRSVEDALQERREQANASLRQRINQRRSSRELGTANLHRTTSKVSLELGKRMGMKMLKGRETADATFI